MLLIYAYTVVTPPNPSIISRLALLPMVGLLPNRRVMTPAVSLRPRVVNGYVRVGPNWWSEHSEVIGDVG